MAVQWDDDGVVPDAYAVIAQGRVVDFHTTRETAPMLTAWAERHGRPLRSHGTAVAETPASVPRGTGGHLTVTPVASAVRLEDVMREMSRGLLVLNGDVSATAGLTAGTVIGSPDGVILDVQRGVPVARVGAQLQFITKTILGKNLRALGDASTLGMAPVSTAKGVPWQQSTQWVSAPAAFCSDVDLTT